MIFKNHDLETLYSQYKIYINDKININFYHFYHNIRLLVALFAISEFSKYLGELCFLFYRHTNLQPELHYDV
jgi:hypothetical protein